MNTTVAGLIAALPLSAVGIVYMLLRGQKIITAITANAGEGEAMSNSQWFILLLASLAVMPFVFALASAFIYGRLANPPVFVSVAFGAAVLFSILALATHTPMLIEKIVMNFLVAVAFGLLMPYLAGR